jgi:hypothetical protein
MQIFSKKILGKRNLRGIGGRTNTGIKPKYDEAMGRIGLDWYGSQTA